MWGFSITGLHMLSCIMFLCVSSYSESIFHSGAVVSFQNVLSNPVLELIVRPGENVTLYCDCNSSTGVYIIWFRNCSHENQQPLYWKPLKPIQKRKFITHMKENIYIIILNGTYLRARMIYWLTASVKLTWDYTTAELEKNLLWMQD